jgi:6-phosphogluconolactonase/glucosamine-6-phosphate isomerase/deaminase
MKYIPGDASRAAALLSTRIISELRAGKSVLWLVPGGSNISIAVMALSLIKSACRNHLSRLFVTLTDERFGPVGHADSNWKQLIDKGFDIKPTQTIHVLRGVDPKESARMFEESFKRIKTDVDVVVGQFGIGDDCHIAGVLPDTEAVDSKKLVVAYETEKYLRITLTLEALKGIDIAFACVFGEPKKEAIEAIVRKSGNLKEKPGLILHEINEAYLVSDVG